MSETKKTVQGTITTIERTRRAIIDTPYTAGSKPDGYNLSIQRETLNIDANGAAIGQPIDAGTRSYWFSAIASETVTAGGVTLTVAQISAFLSAYFDKKMSEPIPAPVMPPMPPPAPPSS